MEAFLGQIHGFAGGRASGQNRNVEGFETCDQEGGRAGADQETSARLPRLLGLRGGTDGSRADDGIGHGGGDGGNGFQRCLRAQGHFENRQATGHKSLGQGDGILDLVDGQNRNHRRFAHQGFSGQGGMMGGGAHDRDVPKVLKGAGDNPSPWSLRVKAFEGISLPSTDRSMFR